ncbi:MAG: hypothetical protein U5K81_08175 [Trueperaceae bacterium]|nr:hypothetical protein [Trueperaceae bacterium]
MDRIARADAGLALVLAATAIVLIATWPVRPDTPNASWYTVSVVRVGALVAWGWLLGANSPPGRAVWRRDLTRLALGAVASAPLEAAAHAATVPAVPVAWGMIIALPASFTALGAGRLATWLLQRARLGALAPIGSLAAAIALVWLDLNVLHSAAFVPWVLPSAPGVFPATVLGVGAAATVQLLARPLAGAQPEGTGAS